MDKLPYPAIETMPLDRYCELGIPHAGVLPKGMKFASIQTSRGCLSAAEKTGRGDPTTAGESSGSLF
jgi:hypothetical protein